MPSLPAQVQLTKEHKVLFSCTAMALAIWTSAAELLVSVRNRVIFASVFTICSTIDPLIIFTSAPTLLDWKECTTSCYYRSNICTEYELTSVRRVTRSPCSTLEWGVVSLRMRSKAAASTAMIATETKRANAIAAFIVRIAHQMQRRVSDWSAGETCLLNCITARCFYRSCSPSCALWETLNSGTSAFARSLGTDVVSKKKCIYIVYIQLRVCM